MTWPRSARRRSRHETRKDDLAIVIFVFFVACTVFVALVAQARAQADVTDADLEASSGGTVVRVGPADGNGRVFTLPLEVYVARVLAGEGEPRAAEAASQALAVAIRTYAVGNAGRHARNGFDVCDSTHCQVPRTATAATRRAALATAGQLLTYNGEPAEVFYSASCGGHSETAANVWPGADYPYMHSAPDAVHDDDQPWEALFTLREVERALTGAGFEGRLKDVRIDERSVSGRATRLQVAGLRPDMVAGDQFRLAVGATRLRSTAFSVEKRGSSLRFTGRGYGHGVGMCVIGAGRRAARGESVEAILGQYFPGLQLTRHEGIAAVRSEVAPRPETPPPAVEAPRAGHGGIVVTVGRSSPVTTAEVETLAARAHTDLSTALGVSVAPISIRVHESLETFRMATGRPWWVSSVSDGTSIDLAPATLLAQRDGFDAALRTALAELLVSDALRGRPRWIRVGAARFFGRGSSIPPPDSASRDRCPSDAELTLALSAPAQRAAEVRAEACFAREYGKTRNWRTVK